jgi:hypothetical protein
VLLNVERGRRLLHCRGVRQGDPLSLMLFLLAIEPLHLLFHKAQESGLLKKFSIGSNILGYSLYADDATLFIHPIERELRITYFILHFILQFFASASGLVPNMAKTHYYPIQCENINLDFFFAANRIISTLPCTYLGLPLDIRKDIQSYAPCAYSKDCKTDAWLEGKIPILSCKRTLGENSADCNAYSFSNNVQNASMGHIRCR